MKLDKYLETAKIKPARFADDIGVSASTLSRVLSGKRKPSLALIAKIERATDQAVTFRDLYDGAHPAAPSAGKAA